jgi:GNAT superfamily N-acetyltransferase
VAVLSRVRFAPAGDEDAAAIADLRNAAADDLTRRYATGHWSGHTTERGVRHSMRHARVVVGRAGGPLVAVVRLATRKPWAIDPSYFTPCRLPLYLTDMAVQPGRQRQGIGRRCLEEAIEQARAWPADAIRLDSYDAPAGAGPFYARCGFTERGRVTYRGTPLVYHEMLLR